MFGIMKMLRKDNDSTDERAGLLSLHAGSAVGFGFLPQRNISGCRMTVKAINTYTFDDDMFPSYVLDNGENDINLIIAKDEESGEAHLSLSQRVEERLFSMLFLSKDPQSWFLMKDTDMLHTSRRVMGMQQSWIAAQYKLATIGKGTFVEGDFREHKRPESVTPPRNFEYVMLVDETSEHALEAEKYEDGTLIVYSTVYRPITDIGEITGNAPVKLPNGKGDLPKLKMSAALGNSAGEKVLFDKKPADIITINPKSNGTIPSESNKMPRISDDVLSLDVKLAGRIIEEARSNNMSIAAVIRKVIDLPAVINEQVMISFSLSDAEYTELAGRYKLSPSDHESVRKNIVEELQQFVGNKK